MKDIKQILILGIVGIVSFTNFSCSKDEQSDIEVLDELKVVFQDSFDNNNNQWFTNSDTLYDAIVEGGAYKLYLKEDSFHVWTTVPVEYNTGNDFQINAVINPVKLTDLSIFGLYWGAYTTKDANFFLLDKKGNCTIGYYKNNVPTYLLGWHSTGWVNVGESNTLSVKRDGQLVQYFINGKLVFDEPYRILGTRNVGFYLENNTSITAEGIQVLD